MSNAVVGSIAGWVSAGGIVGILGIVLFFVIQWRKANRDDRQLEIGADASLRETLLGRIRDLEELAARNDQRLDTALADERRRCEAEMAMMRSDFQKQIDGIMRQFLTFQMALAGSSPPLSRSEHSDAALESLKDQMGKASKE